MPVKQSRSHDLGDQKIRWVFRTCLFISHHRRTLSKTGVLSSGVWLGCSRSSFWRWVHMTSSVLCFSFSRKPPAPCRWFSPSPPQVWCHFPVDLCRSLSPRGGRGASDGAEFRAKGRSCVVRAEQRLAHGGKRDSSPLVGWPVDGGGWKSRGR